MPAMIELPADVLARRERLPIKPAPITLTGTLRRTATGTLPGTATGTAPGMPMGTLTGTAPGTPMGTLTSTATGTPTGTATGTLTGTATGTLTGTATGTLTGRATGTGTAAGTLTGTATGTLTGTLLELRPLDLDADGDALHAVSSGAPFRLGARSIDAYDPDELIWRWMSGGPFADASALRGWLAEQVAAPDGLPFTVSVAGTSVGVASFLANQPQHLKIEIGSIWYGPIAQRTGVSAAVTYLLLDRAFALGYRRVEWKCDARNQRSRRAALAYGFTFEGVQDAHYIVKRSNRDTAWYRMLDTEWPSLGERLRSYAAAQIQANP
jgi:RimJ/RimL family protein N-acetyltransferase